MAEEVGKCSRGSCGGGAGGSGRRGGSGRGGAWSMGSYSMKQNEKKPPRRGLGIAQLESLRREEQQMEVAVSFYPSMPTFRYFYPSSASLPNSRVQSEFNPSGSFFQHIPSVPDMDLAATGPVPSPSMRNYSDYHTEMRGWRRVMDHGLDLGLRMNMPLESNLAMGGQGMMQRAGSDQYPLLDNSSSSSASMSLQSYPLEPPSNQSHHHGSSVPFRPQREEVPREGAKRSFPFSSENPAGPYLPFKIHKVGNPIMNRPKEQSSSFSGIDNLGEGPSGSSSMLESSSTDSMTENRVFRVECLPQAPPMDTPPWQDWNHGQHYAYRATRSYNPYPGFEFLQYQESREGLFYRQITPGWTDQRPFQQPYYNFLPPTNNVENTNTDGGSKEDTSESVDLDLKL